MRENLFGGWKKKQFVRKTKQEKPKKKLEMEIWFDLRLFSFFWFNFFFLFLVSLSIIWLFFFFFRGWKGTSRKHKHNHKTQELNLNDNDNNMKKILVNLSHTYTLTHTENINFVNYTNNHLVYYFPSGLFECTISTENLTSLPLVGRIVWRCAQGKVRVNEKEKTGVALVTKRFRAYIQRLHINGRVKAFLLCGVTDVNATFLCNCWKNSFRQGRIAHIFINILKIGKTEENFLLST